MNLDLRVPEPGAGPQLSITNHPSVGYSSRQKGVSRVNAVIIGEALPFWNLICPDSKTLENTWPKRSNNGNIARVAAPGHEDPAQARHVIARIERIPLPPNPGFEPRREIADRVRGRSSDIAQITRAITRGNIHAAAKGDCKMRVITANSGLFVKCLQ